MKIYLVRHGEVPHNKLKQYNNENEDLNETGIIQAEDLKTKIKKIDYDVIISSPLLRTKHTAEIINVKNKEIIYDDRLKERDPGSLSGKSLEVTNRKEYWNYYTKIQYGTSEPIQPFFARVYDFIEDLKKMDYHSVIIVSHSGVSKAFNSYFEGIKDGQFLKTGLKNCEIKEYEFGGVTMIHEMKLQPEPFQSIKQGSKKIEMRLYDDKRKKIKVGDTIIFKNTKTQETLETVVQKLHIFDNFEQLYQQFDKVLLGYQKDEPANFKDMEQYYSKEEQKNYGVVGIEIKLQEK